SSLGYCHRSFEERANLSAERSRRLLTSLHTPAATRLSTPSLTLVFVVQMDQTPSTSRPSPRQMWDLDPEVEKRLAGRSIWVRGLGVGSKAEDILPLLQRTGSIPQRVRIYKMGSKDELGEFAVYATYDSEEQANLNMTRLCSTTHRHHRLSAKKAGPEGAYRPLTEGMKRRIAMKNLTKDDRMKLIQKKKSMMKLDKIRQLNSKLLEVSPKNGSPKSEGVTKVATEASRPKEDLKLKRKSSDEPSTSNREEVDRKRIRQEDPPNKPISREMEERKKDRLPRAYRSKEDFKPKWKLSAEHSTSNRDEVDWKRIRQEDPQKRPISREGESKKEERVPRGPRTPPSPPNIDRRARDDTNPFLDKADQPRSFDRRKHRPRGGKKYRSGRDASNR
ncbi:hypothetical protein PENTCL1PPCAC_28256, partial [Pristionchus entomophagus]